MPTCWIIEQGDYSDYRVVGIFTTRENAERALKFIKHNNNHYDTSEITERQLDPCIAELNTGLQQFVIRIDHGQGSTKTLVEESTALEASDYHYKLRSIYFVFARDQDHALKIATERHAQYLATKEGTSPCPTGATPICRF